MTIDRKIKCSNLNCPHESSFKFSDWIRKKLPDSSTGFSVSDIDFILWNWKTNKAMLIEMKTRSSNCKAGQYQFFKHLNSWIKNGISKDWKYLGFHLIVFEHTSFADGKCFFDNKEITETELINKLSF